MTPTPFSFIVACYNSAAYVDECLASLSRQDYPKASYEIVCIDDGSTDGSPAIIGRYTNLPNFVTERTENHGLEKTCNHGIRKARNERVVRVDADDALSPDFLKRMDRAITSEPELDFYYCKNYVEYYSAEQKFEKELPDFDPEEIFGRGDFFASGTVYKKKDVAAAGFFPEEVKNCGIENYALVLELLKKGKKGLAVAGASFLYRRHDSNMSLLQRDSIVANGKKLLARHGRPFRTNQYHPYGLKIDTSEAAWK